MTQLEHHYAQLSEVQMHYTVAGEGEPLVLLHGYPQTWLCWQKTLPFLTDRFRVIMPDLRGLGDTSRPAGGYDKKTVAADVWELVHDRLGIETFHLAGHDWGGVVAFRLAADHRDAVSRLAIVDVAIPGDGAPDIGQGGRRWHHRFLQTLDLPEALVEGREHHYLGWFWRNYGHRPDAIDPADIAEYLRVYTSAGATRAGFAYYRSVTQDVADNTGLPPLDMPVLAVGGGTSWGRGTEVAISCRTMAKDVTEVVIDECGHWVPDEQPEELAGHFRSFFTAART
ncbi:alpha/beta hydrolase [Streptomyces sp. NPDC006332]|uniref:alpha/beta fold hydrolase n=1 Tax=Streptomyces sp. NPDC006332 TaxID=3155456 RepID=UPI0033A0EDBD